MKHKTQKKYKARIQIQSTNTKYKFRIQNTEHKARPLYWFVLLKEQWKRARGVTSLDRSPLGFHREAF